MNKSIIKRNSGIALLEFAVALPLLVLLLVVLLESGRLYYTYMRLTAINYEGARFFASLKDPVPACISSETTNLAYARSDYYGTLDEEGKKIFAFHKTVQDRVLSLFSYRAESWPIESDSLVPTGEPSVQLRLKNTNPFGNLPSISTQYVKDNSVQNCPPPLGSDATGTELNNTVTVCLEGNYNGPFYSIPLYTCSTTGLLEENELLTVPEIPDDTGWGGEDDSGGLIGAGGEVGSIQP